jgi:predicted RNA-binding Zn-ribbon protein involved in translation (DUF1610 family)
MDETDLLLESGAVASPEVPINPDESLASQEATAPEYNEEEEKKCFEQLLKDARDEDRYVRDEQVRVWKRLEYYWNNILDIFLDPVSKDWTIPNWEELEGEGEIPPRLINIYRPHGEAIVAALSVTIPAIVFYPDDAENPDHLETAKACRTLSELLIRHNDGTMLFIRMLVIMFNQGTVFGYNYYKEDPKYGTVDRPIIGTVNARVVDIRCHNCGEPLDGMLGEMPAQQEPYECDNCGVITPGVASETTEQLPQITGWNKEAKGSIAQEIFSGLNVKIPAYCKKQEECGYLLLEFHQSVGMLRSIFSDKANKISPRGNYEGDKFERLPAYYRGTIPDNTAVVSALWVRPWQFWTIGTDTEHVEKIGLLEKRYPKGAYAIFIDDELMEVVEESMDDHWTISKNPLGSSLYARPLGENLSTIQDIRAQLVEIEIQTAEHGIPETFADPKVLDFNKYGQTRSRPGMVTQAKPRPGKSLADAFHTSKAAILSQEIDPLRQHIDQDGQFVVGSFPSVYGGPATSGSKTAREYSESRSVALQRLGTVNKIGAEFWAEFQGKSVNEMIQVLREEGRDEKFVMKQGNSFVNIWIKNSSLTGRVGKVEAESADQLPVSWAQKKDAIMTLLQTGIPEIQALLMHPKNLVITKNAMGLQDLFVPGEDDANKQLKEFAMLSTGVAVPTNPMLDKDEIHIEILTGLLAGIHGESLDEQGMMLCMQHLMEHQVNLAAKTAQAGQSVPEEQTKENSDENEMAE